MKRSEALHAANQINTHVVKFGLADSATVLTVEEFNGQFEVHEHSWCTIGDRWVHTRTYKTRWEIEKAYGQPITFKS